MRLARIDDLASELRGISLALTGTSRNNGAGSGNRTGGGSSGTFRGGCSVVQRRPVEPTPRRATTPRSSDYTSAGNAKHWDTGYYSSS